MPVKVCPCCGVSDNEKEDPDVDFAKNAPFCSVVCSEYSKTHEDYYV